jgi:hypothetical protein
MRPTEIVCRELGGTERVTKNKIPSTRKRKGSWTAAIWSCHGPFAMRLVGATAATKRGAQKALDDKLVEVAREIAQ